MFIDNTFERRSKKLKEEGKLKYYIPKGKKPVYCEICGERVTNKTWYWKKHPLCSYKCNVKFTNERVEYKGGVTHLIKEDNNENM